MPRIAPLFLLLSALLFVGGCDFSPAPKPKTCFLVGDSIGVGLSWYLKTCPASAKVGLSSNAVLKRTEPADVLIVSAGSNDPDNKRLEANLKAIRDKSGAATVIWIEPRHKRASAIVRKIAQRNGDLVIFFKAGKDKVHPRSYKRLARDVAQSLKGLL
ncbi:hypothetical protein SAMN04515647_1680 [Cohaesibacter sp. ES.047]|uniref:SGNH/GDSL hydrolase family protein n=1 Tax=Cohaesibacter sp. ES.047 TaxID=1798205 RepID=UPI000BB8D284|nr:SGNH/GDSL hydrolase family protein [Cohaesibacter sp. ES.047]SNY91459.1 hypothetical protein SAMN04515647_1680 [Cohaesibacter sp. ES.047]